MNFLLSPAESFKKGASFRYLYGELISNIPVLKNLVFFASGSGSNFQSVIDAATSHRLSARITGLIASRTGIGAIERAVQHGIPYEVIPETGSLNGENKMMELLQIWNPDLIVLAGYLQKIPDSLILRYPRAIINIHPSLLPKFGGKGFYGLNVHQAVLDAGEKISGCSVHYVTEEYDAGDVIRQAEVPVESDDTPESLASRILKAEHKLLPQVIQELLKT